MRWVNRRPRRGNRMLLGAIPIILLIVLYLSNLDLAKNLQGMQ